MTLNCQQSQELTSLFLDGRLVASRRAEVQEHLRVCESCMAAFRSLRRLSSLASHLPSPEVRPDLAARVRADLQKRRAPQSGPAQSGPAQSGPAKSGPAQSGAALSRPVQSRSAQPQSSHRGRLLVAALLILMPLGGLAWVLRDSIWGDGLVDIEEVAVAPQPASVLWNSCRDAGIEPGLFARAARGVVGDLALSRDVRPADCRAMLAVQLDLFDLERGGSRLLRITEANDGAELVLDMRRLARFVIDLAEDVDQPRPDFDLRRWQAAARDSKLYDLTELAAAQTWRPKEVAEPISGLVARVASDLAPASQQELVRLLVVKSNWVHGDHGASLGIASSLTAVPLRSRFGASMDYTLASSLYAADRPKDALPFVKRLTQKFSGDGPSMDDPLAGAWLRGVVDAELASNR